MAGVQVVSGGLGDSLSNPMDYKGLGTFYHTHRKLSLKKSSLTSLAVSAPKPPDLLTQPSGPLHGSGHSVCPLPAKQTA